MSSRDLPVWARAVAALLLLFASWWLWSTDPLRAFAGGSIGVVSLGAIAASILRGMGLPLGVWPDGPWRTAFLPWAVVTTGIAFGAIVILVNPGGVALSMGPVDRGGVVAATAGVVALGYGISFVRQQRFLSWYVLAAALALVPPVVGVVVGGSELQEAAGVGRCVWSAVAGQDATPVCAAGFVPTLLFFSVFFAAAKLATEEIAFRRLLVGTGRPGLISVMAGAVAATAWYALLADALGMGAGLVVLGGLGAVTAGCLYALSGSLVVSSVFSAVYAAGYLAMALSFPLGEEEFVARVPTDPAIWISSAAIAVVLGTILTRRRGVLGDLARIDERSTSVADAPAPPEPSEDDREVVDAPRD